MSDPYKTPAAPLYQEVPYKRLPTVWNPLSWLVATTVMMAIEAAWFTYVGEDTPRNTNQMWAFFFGVLVAWWVHSDRRARGVSMPYEFEAFVVFLWPIVLPYYLYRTRGWTGLLLGAGFWLLFLVPTVLSLLIYASVTE